MSDVQSRVNDFNHESEISSLKVEIKLLKGAMYAQEERDLAATKKVGIPPGGCDTSDDLADLLLEARGVSADKDYDYDVRIIRLDDEDQVGYMVFCNELNPLVFYGSGKTKTEALLSFEVTLKELIPTYKEENRPIENPVRHHHPVWGEDPYPTSQKRPKK